MHLLSQLIIRRENNKDHEPVYSLIESAFNRSSESALVEKLRYSDAAIPELSLVATLHNKIVGHILFTKIKIINDQQIATSALALAPLSVLPQFQNKGIGKRLIETGLEKAKELGYKLVSVLGHADYYPRFGFLPAGRFHIEAPIAVPPQNFMVIELTDGALEETTGLVEYAPEFNILSARVRSGLIIETERLILRPLTYPQLVNYVKCDHSLEKELNLNRSSRTLSDELKEAFEQSIFPNVADTSKNHLYATIWTAISKAENIMVGDICMYGEPSVAGEVEIGYGTYAEFQQMGYMTEIVGGFIQWLNAQPLVNSVFASTEKTNTASFKVLEKNGFIKTEESLELLTWQRILAEENKS